MKRSIYLYALTMAGLLFLLQAVKYQYLIYDLREEFFIGFLAILFTTLGLWIGWRITTKRRETAIEVQAHRPAVSANEIGISTREEEVLRLMAAGHSNQEIADQLFISLNTVKKHTSTLFRKLNAERRTQAIEKARQIGIIA